MNTSTHSVRRRIAACAVAAVVLPAFAACGADLEPPAQDISRDKVDKKSDTPTVPEYTSGNRYEFGDEYGKRAMKKHEADPPEERSLNRLDFRDNGL